jgi:FMN-dependent NADH-azoreductase
VNERRIRDGDALPGFEPRDVESGVTVADPDRRLVAMPRHPRRHHRQPALDVRWAQLQLFVSGHNEQKAALALAATLTDELVAADALLSALPLYNFGVSQHFKTWVDMVITDPRMAAGAQPILAGKPAVLVTVRGGNYRPGTPREGWDHATGWMRRILADVWHLDLKVVQAEFTLVGVNPALDQFTDLARQLRREAEEQARRHGRELGAAVTSAMAA